MKSSWKKSVDFWNVFWFETRPPETIVTFRIACGLLTSIHFALLINHGSQWYGPNGLLNVDAGRYLIGETVEGTGSAYRWSLLFSFPALTPLVAGLGLIASLATVAGLGARLSPIAVWLCMCTFQNRAPLLTLLYEPLLFAMMAYLAIDPGRLTWTIQPGFTSGPPRMSVNLVSRLTRCHLWIWIAFSLSSMLANSIWWNGEAVWMLMKQQRAWIELPDGFEWCAQVLTHVVIATQAGFLICVIQGTFDWLARWLLLLFALSVLLLLGDWMYASVLIVSSLALWPFQVPFQIAPSIENDNSTNESRLASRI